MRNEMEAVQKLEEKKAVLSSLRAKNRHIQAKLATKEENERQNLIAGLLSARRTRWRAPWTRWTPSPLAIQKRTRPRVYQKLAISMLLVGETFREHCCIAHLRMSLAIFSTHLMNYEISLMNSIKKCCLLSNEAWRVYAQTSRDCGQKMRPVLLKHFLIHHLQQIQPPQAPHPS